VSSYQVCPTHGPYDLYSHEDGCPECITEWERESASDPNEMDWTNPNAKLGVFDGPPVPNADALWFWWTIHERPIWMCD